MSEYWVSQARHHCDFCKCWIADNKPSRDFHERGKKHIENVKKKIDEIRKKGEKKAQDEVTMENDLAEMEREALKAFKEDLQANPSMASLYGVSLEKKEEKPVVEGPKLEHEVATEDSESDQDEQTEPEAEEKCVWAEAKSPEGWTYYWNRVTSEVTWIKPDDYKSPEEAVKKKSATTSEDEPKVKKARVEEKNVDQVKPADTTPAVAKGPASNRAAAPSVSRAVVEPVEPVSNFGPQPKPCAYGQWETIEKEEAPQVDLELPINHDAQEEVKTIPVSEPKMKFREKSTPSLGSELVAFKKRNKKKSNFNFRKKDDD